MAKPTEQQKAEARAKAASRRAKAKKASDDFKAVLDNAVEPTTEELAALAFNRRHCKIETVCQILLELPQEIIDQMPTLKALKEIKTVGADTAECWMSQLNEQSADDDCDLDANLAKAVGLSSHAQYFTETDYQNDETLREAIKRVRQEHGAFELG